MPLGRYTFDVAAFKAVSSSRELFMQADGASAKPWKYNGVTCAEIAAAPAGGKFIKAHAFHLFIGFEDGSLQWSELGNPTLWGALGGAGELGVSDNIARPEFYRWRRADRVLPGFDPYPVRTAQATSS
jgi:hypothetical protein